MNDNKMLATTFAKKLRARRVELRKAHTVALRKYDVDFMAWKVSLAAWLKQSAAKNVDRIMKGDMDRGSYHNRSWSNVVLDGHPVPPKKPSDETVRRIDAKLRHIAITGQKYVTVTERDTEELFGSTEDDDE